MTVKDLAEIYPERFSNKTNGVTPRRWLLAGEPGACRAPSPRPLATVGSPTLVNLRKLAPLAEDRGFSRRHSARPSGKPKSQFANWLEATCGQTVDPETIFDCQVKRIHEYKRQLLNALAHRRALQSFARTTRTSEVTPRTFFFAGKAAPAYHLAKLIIKFINNLADDH